MDVSPMGPWNYCFRLPIAFPYVTTRRPPQQIRQLCFLDCHSRHRSRLHQALDRHNQHPDCVLHPPDIMEQRAIKDVREGEMHMNQFEDEHREWLSADWRRTSEANLEVLWSAANGRLLSTSARRRGRDSCLPSKTPMISAPRQRRHHQRQRQSPALFGRRLWPKQSQAIPPTFDIAPPTPAPSVVTDVTMTLYLAQVAGSCGYRWAASALTPPAHLPPLRQYPGLGRRPSGAPPPRCRRHMPATPAPPATPPWPTRSMIPPTPPMVWLSGGTALHAKFAPAPKAAKHLTVSTPSRPLRLGFARKTPTFRTGSSAQPPLGLAPLHAI